MTNPTHYLPPFSQIDVQFDGRTSIKEFLQRYELLAISYGWSEADKLRFFPQYLRDGAKAWYDMYRHAQAKLLTKTYMDVDLVWANLKTEIEAAYAITETQENIALRLKEVTYQKCGSALSYVYAVLSLLQRMDAGMTVEKRIKYLLKGLPPDLAVKVYDQRPKTDMEVKDILLHHEKFLAMYPQKSNQLQKDVAGSNWPELENTLKNLQLQSENTYMAKSNPTDFSPNRNGSFMTPNRSGYSNAPNRSGFDSPNPTGYFNSPNRSGYTPNRNGQNTSPNPNGYQNTPNSYNPQLAINAYSASHEPSTGGEGTGRYFTRRGDKPYSIPNPNVITTNPDGDQSLFKFIRQYRDEQGRPICWRCGENGHDKLDCPQRKRLMARAKNLMGTQSGKPQEN